MLQDYNELMKSFPLRPINNDEELEQAIKIAETIDFGDNVPEEAKLYNDVLLDHIEKYEDEHYPIPDIAEDEMEF